MSQPLAATPSLEDVTESIIFPPGDIFSDEPPLESDLQGFHLVDGQYQDLVPTESGWLWSQQLGLYLAVYLGKLRFFTPDGHLVMLPEEESNQQAFFG
ncbi:hypothetical protein A4S05_12835 [Nostoc sp. KVJ20]|uniref:hypothetical protein n=1 Tax=Nostoc sp. KVJ20 TaxID=457944 RepID=UPI00083D1E02|nr:hypothetical protein [Nostoc sp. KVJ20]ODG97581.1 hypothetical protein A4S05_12835 [Nostoc sp. KVJ20]